MMKHTLAHKTCQEFITATARCGKLAVVTEIVSGDKRDMCAECATRIYLRLASGKPW